MDCTDGVCSPTAKKATLSVSDLENYLSSGSLEITTSGPGVQAHDIEIDAGVTWTSSFELTLDAYDSVVVNQPVVVQGSSGLTVTTNDGGNNGVFSFGPKGAVSFANLSSSLVIDGTKFSLVNSLPSLANAVDSNPGGAYALANAYDASQDGTYSDAPITATLTGIIQGLGNTISNLSINHTRENYINVGLLRNVDTTGAVENLRLAGIAYSSRSGAGGLVGGNSGLLFDDRVSGTVVAKGSAGGLANGNLQTGIIASSSANVRVTGRNGYGAGLVTSNVGAIEYAYAEGKVRGLQVGGLVEENGSTGSISQSFATGSVTGEYGGGLVNDNLGTISDTYATGAVSGPNAGGLVGEDSEENAPVSTSWSKGVVPSGGGGFVCDPLPANFANGSDYWDTTTSGTTYGACGDLNVNGVTGLTTQQLQSGLPAGFDPKVWAEDPKINQGLPYLINNPPPKK